MTDNVTNIFWGFGLAFLIPCIFFLIKAIGGVVITKETTGKLYLFQQFMQLMLFLGCWWIAFCLYIWAWANMITAFN